VLVPAPAAALILDFVLAFDLGWELADWVAEVSLEVEQEQEFVAVAWVLTEAAAVEAAAVVVAAVVVEVSVEELVMTVPDDSLSLKEGGEVLAEVAWSVLVPGFQPDCDYSTVIEHVAWQLRVVAAAAVVAFAVVGVDELPEPVP
jgi:hypothetical protein